MTIQILIEIYLLAKSAFRCKFTLLDRNLANVLDTFLRGMGPSWLAMIGNMQQEAPLPEAFNDFLWDIEQDLKKLLED